MIIANSWRQAYTKLTEFIAEHSEIKIASNYAMIPEGVRPEFYRLFDDVRESFMKEEFKGLLNNGRYLSLNLNKIKEEVIGLFGLDISLPIELQSFMDDPNYELRTRLFHMLFDLLRGTLDAEYFEKEARREVAGHFAYLYRSGYVKWLAFCLLKMLEPQRIINIPLPELPDPVKTEFPPGRIEKHKLVPEETTHLSLERAGLETFIGPDFIIQLAKMGHYVAMGTDLGSADATFANPSRKREWLLSNTVNEQYSSHGLLFTWPDLVINLGDEPEDIAIFADFKNICRPDLIIECRAQENWYEQQGLEEIKLHHGILKPLLGTFVVSREPVPEQAHLELLPEQDSEASVSHETEKQGEKGIHILTVGFEQTKLEPIAKMLRALRTN